MTTRMVFVGVMLHLLPRGRLIVAGLVFVLVAAVKSPADPTRITYIVYFAPEPTRDPQQVVDELMQTTFAGVFARGAASDDKPNLTHRWLPTAEFPPPSEHLVPYESRDAIATDVADALRHSTRAYLFEFTATTNLLATNHHICEFIGSFAQWTQGYPWDDEARLIYTPDSWRKRRSET